MSAPLYLLAWAGTLADQLAGWRWAGIAAGVALFGFLLWEFPRQRTYARVVFCGLIGLGLVGLACSTAPAALAADALRRAAAFAAFFLALGTLRDAAETSPLVRRCGAQLVAQPSGRRYAALAVGGHVFGIILSYGAIDLLAAMVMRANGDDPGRARRMLLAMQRGFCTMNCWAPLNLMTVVVAAAFPDAPMWRLLPFALSFALLALAVGWAEDRLRGRGGEAAAPPATTERWSVHLGILGLIAGVTLVAELVAWIGGVRLAVGVTLGLPVIAMCWWAVQGAGCRARSPAATAARRAVAFHHRIPGFRGEATVLGASGFAGVAFAGLFPAGGLAPLLEGIPGVLIALFVPLLLIVTGQIGLNPIAVVAILGAGLPDPASLGVAPAVLAFACMLSWGIAVGVTPMSASALITARWAGASPWRVSTVWNGVYTSVLLLLAWLAIGAMHALW